MMFAPLLLIALSTLVSEDLACIAAGTLVAQQKLGLLEGILACTSGIFTGDMLLFAAGRAAAKSGYVRRWMEKYVTEEKLQQANEWLKQRGLVVVLLSRFTPGLRLSTYLAAGLLRSRVWNFAAYFLLASLLWTPLLVGGTALYGEHVVQRILRQDSFAAVAFIADGAIGLQYLWRIATRYEFRRLVVGFFLRKVRWEFWPAWAAYIPLIPYWVYLAIRYRSATLFTAANPGIASGGLCGESKSEILGHMSRVDNAVADFAVVGTACEAQQFMNERGLSFPIVLKPDIGERAKGVAVIRRLDALRTYFTAADQMTIVQRYIPGLEFGVFYVRYPNRLNGEITSITEKRFPSVIGDGVTPLWNLILRDPRAVCMAPTYRRLSKRPVSDVPALGERVQLAELGSHCRGAIFLDGYRLLSAPLQRRIEEISRAHPGFFIGRFDVRAESVEAFRAGKFQVIELNGVSAEPAHIYDPAVSLWSAYQAMFQQWRTAFEIGALNRANGACPMRVRDLLKLILLRPQEMKARRTRVAATQGNKRVGERTLATRLL